MPLTDNDIVQLRGPKNAVDPRRPYAFLNEPEFAASGVVEQVCYAVSHKPRVPVSVFDVRSMEKHHG